MKDKTINDLEDEEDDDEDNEIDPSRTLIPYVQTSDLIDIGNGDVALLCIAGFNEDEAKKGQIYQCVRSMNKDRIGQMFTITGKVSKEMLSFYASYGDAFNLVQGVQKIKKKV